MPDSSTKKLKSNDALVRRVYPLTRLAVTYEDGRKETILPTPEQIAVAIAKCSRSESPFDQNIIDVSLEKAAEFHEKWVVGYGHSSVAEHAVASVAFEHVSQVVIKILEDCRLASFTEKSSRYIVFSRDRVVLPEILSSGPLGERVSEFFDRLYALYDTIQERVRPLMHERYPKPEDMTDRAYSAVTKARVCDVARYCLPAAAAGNLGMTGNARVWEHVITKLASSPHEEAHALAQDLLSHLRAASDESPDDAIQTRLFPTLLKYAKRNSYVSNLPERIKAIADELLEDAESAKPYATREQPVVMMKDDDLAEARIAAAILAKASRLSMSVILKKMAHDPEAVEKVMQEVVAERGEHDPLPREFEHATFQHEIVMDYGAWRDIQRHRMCTQLNQSLGVDLGYVVPEEITEVHLADNYRSLMEEAAMLYAAISRAGFRHEAEYIIPMAYLRRLVVSWNVRELDHFISLRSGKKGHPSYRRIAQETWRTLEQTHPLLARLVRVDLSGNDAGLSTLGSKPKGI